MGGKRFFQGALNASCVGFIFAMASFGVAQANSSTMAESAVIVSPWAPATDEATYDGVAYFTIRNDGDRSIRLIEARTTVADVVSLGKTTTETDGDLHSSAFFQVVVPPNGLVTLKPGGQLVLLRDLTEPLVAGSEFVMRLTFYDGSLLSINVPVQSVGDTGKMK